HASAMKEYSIKMEVALNKATAIMNEVTAIWDSPKAKNARAKYDEFAQIFPKAKQVVENIGIKIETSARNFEINE
ncbi:MAG: hypothetical protein RR325_03215, partial [Bacilli bacterium]